MLVVLIRWRNARAYGQDVGGGAGFVLVVEPDGAIGAKIVSVSRCGGITSLDAIRSSAGHYLSTSVHNQIDFFGSLVMMREVSASGHEVHPEKLVTT